MRMLRTAGARPLAWSLGIVVGLGVFAARGQEAAAPAAATNAAPEVIDTQADSITYDRTTGWVVARGNVIITKGRKELRADYVRVNVQTEDAHAYGNVRLREGDEVQTADSLEYNFGEKVGEVRGLEGGSEPFRVISNESVERLGPSTFVMHDTVVTTCTNREHRLHYRVKAREATLVPDEYMRLKGAVWYFGKAPVLYLPYWKKGFDDEYGWELRPGHSSRWGAFLLAAYRYPLSEHWKGRTHVDYYEERGIGAGQDLSWSYLTKGTGDLRLYYIDDDRPIDDDEDLATADIDPERYRIRFRHYWGMGPRDYLVARAHLLSDTDMLEDFFEREYRRSAQPENEVSYTHRGDWYTANLLLRGRINDFYGNVNRLPEASLDIMRQPLGRSPIYYEGKTSASYLERVFPERSAEEEYSALRVDSLNTLLYPKKYFGFLNLIPRAGVRGTYYSETRRVETVTNIVTVVQTNGLAGTEGATGTQTNTTTRFIDLGADFRTIYELGMEASFKAFRVWDDGGMREPIRHVAEPYADYTYRLEPSVLPDELYRFDAIDALDELHRVKLGMRNKLQEKREGRARDVLDIDVYTFYRFEYPDEEQALGDFFLDSEYTPNAWLSIDNDGIYDTEEGAIDRFNTQIGLIPNDTWQAAIEHRYIRERSSLLTGSLTLNPNAAWVFNVYGRQEMEDSRLEEVGGYIQRNLDCMAFRLGSRVMPSYTRADGTQREEDYKVTFEWWLTAFPGFGLLDDER